MSKILLETNKLKKTFNHSSGSITLFDNLDLKIREGELVALVGPLVLENLLYYIY